MAELEPLTGTAAYEVDTTPLERLTTSLHSVAKESAEVARYFQTLDTAASQGAAGAKRVGDETARTAQRAVDVNQALRETQRVLGAVTEAYSASLREASRFGHEMGQVATLSKEVRGDTERYRQEVLLLATSLGVDAVQAANGFYEVLSAGSASTAAGGLKIVETAMRAAVAGATDTSTAVDGITTAINAWRLGADQAGRVSDVMFKAVAEGKMTFGEMSSAMFQAAPLASSLGVSLEEVSAAVTTITKGGAPASVAFTQVRSAMTGLITPGDDLQQIFAVIAERNKDVTAATGPAIIQALGFHGALQEVVGVAGELGIALPTALGRIEGVNAALAISGDNAEAAARDLELMNQSAGETDRAYAEMAKTFEFQSEKMRVASQAVMIEMGTTLGQMLVPALQAAQEGLNSYLHAWEDSSEGTRRGIITFTGLFGVLGTGAGTLAGIRLTVQALKPALDAAGLSARAMSLSFGAIAGVTLVISALVKGAGDLNETLEKSYKRLQENGEGFDAYYGAVRRAQEQATGLAGIYADLNTNFGAQHLLAKEGGRAWLEYSLGVDKAVLTSRAYREQEVQLQNQLVQGRIGLKGYREGLLAAADAASVATGHGHVLSEAQRKVADEFVKSRSALAEHAEGISSVTVRGEDFQKQAVIFAEAVQREGMDVGEATGKLMAYGQALDLAAGRTRAAAEDQARATGVLQTYSAEFQKLTGAGTQWKGDPAEQSKQVQAAQEDLKQGIRDNLREQLDLYDQYQQDVARLSEVQATAGGGNAQRVEQQYAEEIAIRRKALAQMITDHTIAMVQMGEVSETNAKIVIGTLRETYGVDIVPPEADEAIHVWGLVNDALKGNADAQKELKSAIGGSLDAQVQAREETGKLAKSWAQTAGTSEVSAERITTATGRVITSSGDLVAETQRTGSLIRGAHDDMAVSSETLAERAEGSLSRWSTASDLTATDIGTHAQRTDEVTRTLADQVSGHVDSIVGSTGRIGGGYQAAASEVLQACSAMETKTGEVDRAIATFFANNDQYAKSMSKVWTDNKVALDALTSGVKPATTEVAGLKTTSSETGTETTRQLRGVADSSEDMARRMVTSMDTSKRSLSDTQLQAEDLHAALDDIPRDVQIRVSMDGLEVVLTGLDRLGSEFRQLLHAADAAGAAVAAATAGAGDSGTAAPGAPAPQPPGRPGQPPLTVRPGPSGVVTTSGFTSPGRRTAGSVAVPEWADASEKAMARLSADITQGLGDGYNVTIFGEYVPKSPEVVQEGDGLALRRHILDIYEATQDPVIWMVEFDDTQFMAAIADANRALFEAQSAADVFGARLQATFNQFLKGGEGETGSLAWLTNKWSGSDFKPFEGEGMAKFFSGLNVPVQTMEQFTAYWDKLDPEKQADLWKRMYDDLRRLEKERHDQRVAALQSEMEEARAHGKDLYAEQLQDQLDDEAERHDRINGQLEERDRLIKRQFEDWRDGYRDVTEAERELQAAQRERERAEEEFRRKQMERLREEQRVATDMEQTSHDEVMRLLGLEEDRIKSKYARELALIDALMAKEDSRHDKVLQDLDARSDAIRTFIEQGDTALRKSRESLDAWITQESGLDFWKRQVAVVGKAIEDLTAKTTRAQRARPKPEDLTRVDVTPEIRNALNLGTGLGLFSPEQQRLADIALSQGRLRSSYLRQLLELVEEYTKTQVEGIETEIERRKRLLDIETQKWATVKQGLQDELDGIDKLRKIEDERHTQRMGELAGRRTATEANQTAELAGIEHLRQAEDARHKARMEQLEREYAYALMINEGLTPEQAALRIAEMRGNVDRAIAQAAKLLEELRRNTGTPTPPPGSQPAPPGPISPPGQPGPITPPGPGPTGGGSGMDPQGRKVPNPEGGSGMDPLGFGQSPKKPLWVTLTEAAEAEKTRLPGQPGTEGAMPDFGSIGRTGAMPDFGSIGRVGLPGQPGTDNTQHPRGPARDGYPRGMPDGGNETDHDFTLPHGRSSGRAAAYDYLSDVRAMLEVIGPFVVEVTEKTSAMFRLADLSLTELSRMLNSGTVGADPTFLGAGGGKTDDRRGGDTYHNNFYAPVYMEDDTPPARHLRRSLGGGWGGKGTP